MPSEYPHLRRAPIVEAVLDVRTVLPPGTRVEGLRELPPHLRDAYPDETPQHGVAARFSISAADAKIDQAPKWLRGYMFHSTDDLYRVQFRQDGFTMNRLSPYTDWDDVAQRARAAWTAFASLSSPQAVTRVAVRYINRFELRLPVELGEYLVSAPELPPQVPQDLSGFLWRWVVGDEETGAMCNLIQASEIVAEAQSIGILLDIDCFMAESIEPDEELVFGRLAQLRGVKNRIFFGSLTPKALEMFK